MAYGQRPGQIEGFDFLALIAIGILVLSAAHLTGVIDRLAFDIPRVDLGSQIVALTTGRSPVAAGFAASRDRGHRVRPGETLGKIAARYRVTPSELIQYNRLANPDRIEPGDVIRIPPQGARARRIDAISQVATPGSALGLGELIDYWLSGSEGTAAPAAPDPALAAVAPEVSNPWGTGEELLAMAEADLRAARFEEALVAARAALRFLDANSDIEDDTRRARVEIALATVYTALGRPQSARRHFRRALAADPGFQLDPAETSPKVLQAFEAARQESTG